MSAAKDVAELREKGLLQASTDFEVVGELDTINICVPTPLRKTKDPDLSYIVVCRGGRRARLRPGMLIVLESTTYPGTTDELVLPILETSGLKAGKDFFLAFSPERIDPGNAKFHTRNVPKVVGGLTPACNELATALYSGAIETIVPVSSPRVAEMVKLLENTFRAVNIGLVNELALMCDRLGIDVWEVVNAAATKPFGFMPFYPGPGLGGHCIPVDPFYLSWKARQSGFEARFIELAGAVNGAMPQYTVSLVATPSTASSCRSTGRRCSSRACRTSATSTTSASRRRSTCSTCCRSVARSCPTAIRTCRRSRARPGRTASTSSTSTSRRRRRVQSTAS